jgi:hypothetical protein
VRTTEHLLHATLKQGFICYNKSHPLPHMTQNAY